MVNVLTAGAIAPVLWGETRWMSLGMLALMASGLSCWVLYLRSARRKSSPALSANVE
jgi:hypothetical protein